MEYDPVKDRFGGMVAGRYWPTRMLFTLLHIFFLRAWYVRRALKDILDGMGGPVQMLDAGTGFGQFAYWVAKKYPNVKIHAVDIKQEYLDRAEIFFTQAQISDRATFAIDDLTELEADGPFDLILSVDVMEHIEEDVRVFEHFFRVLRPGGRLIINTPSDTGGSDVGVQGGESFIGEHVRGGYGREEIRKKLIRAGLVVDSIRYTYSTFGGIAWRLSIKWPMQMLNASFLLIALLPVYYLITLPAALVMNAIDVSFDNDTGTGLMVVAHRP